MRAVPKTLHSTQEGLFIVSITNISVLLSHQESLIRPNFSPTRLNDIKMRLKIIQKLVQIGSPFTEGVLFVYDYATVSNIYLSCYWLNSKTVFSLDILIGGYFRIIDGEKIRPRVRRLPVGSGYSTPADFGLAFEGVS